MHEGDDMAHSRIRKFNTKDAYPDQKLDNDLCMAVRAAAIWRTIIRPPI